MKPLDQAQLKLVVELVVEKLLKESDGRFSNGEESSPLIWQEIFFVKRGNYLAKIHASNIQYIEVDGKFSKLICGSEKFVIQKSLKQVQERLPPRMFVRIHRNCLVNVKEILKINLAEREIILQDGKSLVTSRRYLDELMQHFALLR